MQNLRIAVIGLGNIGQHHAACLAEGRIRGAKLSAVCTSNPSKAANYPGIRAFSEPAEMFKAGTSDAVIITSPHFQHTSQGIAALNQGLHVLVEKPISAHKADAERLIAAHRANPQCVFAAMFQLRTEPRYLRIWELLQAGKLGRIMRVNWTMTDWFRTEAYYASGGWRATWRGEGGGVLLNQCLHNLDMLQWLLGMPACVRGFCQLGAYHNIEVEDNVSAFLEYADGAMGTFVSSTGEAPGTNRLEIAGTRGKLILENEQLQHFQNDCDTLDFSRTAQLGFSKPGCSQRQIPFDNAPNPHALVIQNFVDAIRDGKPLIAPGDEGLHSVELANAILYSSLTGETVELPLDGVAYESKLNQLIAGSRVKQKTVQISGEDFARSFKR
jgi:predicted dehydrogenase